MRIRPLPARTLAPAALIVLAASAAPSGGGPQFSHLAYSQVTIGGNADPGLLGSPAAYTPAPCWLEPRFTGGNSYHPGDPQPSPNGDADSYWWWFASQQPALYPVLGRIAGLKQAVNKVFKSKQGKPGWWWVPAWVNDGGNGFACAFGLTQMLNLSAQYLEFLPPQHGGGDTPGHPIDGQILADLARAELRLPAITVHTSPPVGRPSDVNLPVWVSVAYAGPMAPTDTASVPTPAGVLSATVATSPPSVSIGVTTGEAQVYNQCGATGSPYPGNPKAIPPCGVTFLAPSTGGPFTLTVTARWTVWWTATDSPGRHFFASPPWPQPVQTSSASVTVREIQAINGPGSGH